MLSTDVSPVVIVLLSEETMDPVVGIVIVVLVVGGTVDPATVLLLRVLPTVEVPNVVGVVVGANRKEDDSELKLVLRFDDDKLLLEELPEELTVPLLLVSEDVNEVLVKVVSRTNVDDDFRVVSVGTITVLDIVLYAVEKVLLD